MALKFYCPCGQKLSVGEELLGKHIRCPRCRKVLAAPQPLLNHTEIHDDPEDEADTKKVPPASSP